MEVLILGLGSIAAKHIIALKALDKDVTIFALRSGNNGTDATGVINIYDLSELKTTPDFAIISSPTNLHLQSITQLAELRIPLFIEKPPLHSMDGAHQAVELIKQRSIFTYVACNLRFHPCITFLKDYFEKNSCRVNEVNVYCGSNLPDWRPGIDYKKNYSANKVMGGGVHLDLFHEMDYTCWLFGYPDKSRGFFSAKSSLGIDAVDYVNYLLEYHYRRTPRRTVEILFDTDTWVVDLINCTITAQSGEVIFQSPDFKIMDTYIKQMRYFTACLKDGNAPMNTFENAVKVLQISLKDG
jgi:predicted dehydrogenase